MCSFGAISVPRPSNALFGCCVLILEVSRAAKPNPESLWSVEIGFGARRQDWLRHHMNRIAENRGFQPPRALSLLVATLVLLGVGTLYAQQPTISAETNQTKLATRLDQGCVNQGSDSRVGAPVVCWAQRHLSWKSDHQPPFLLIGRTEGTSVGLAWPPYLVYNSPDRSGRWRMFRIGFRYDRDWRGYIFPTAAWKRVSNPLRY